jgi:hypothetical protein
MKFFLFFFSVISSLYPVSALAVDLRIPLNCKYGQNCFIEKYFDHDKEEEKIVDYNCGQITVDKQYSTDFILKNYKQMKEGVGVVAADNGIVKYVRDGITDINVNLIGVESVHGRECGNGIIIEHKRGYLTQYCHLKEGSIAVQKNEKVDKGQEIGEVGLSGLTTFPYLQFTVLKNKRPLDPFTGEDPTTGDNHVPCGSYDIYPLWDRETERYLRYIQTALLSTGFTSRVPHVDGAREGKFSKSMIYDDAKILVFWVDIFGIKVGDFLRLVILGPDGKEVLKEEKEFTSAKGRYFQFIGKKLDKGKKWSVGEYTGRVELVRSDMASSKSVIDSSDTKVAVMKRPKTSKKD